MTLRQAVMISIAWLIFSPAHAADFTGVPRIVDGDTLAIGETKVRLEGIDAPETDQVCLNAAGKRWTCGIDARDQLTAHIAGREIKCSSNGIDAYRRMRVSRMQHKMQTAMEQGRVRQQAMLDAERAEQERKAATAQAEFERERAQITAAAQQSAWLVHGKAHADLRAACVALKGRADAERARRQAAEAEAAALRARLAALEEEALLRFVA